MKRYIMFLMLLALVSPSLSGCFGKFALTRNVYHVNASVPDKLLRSMVTWAFVIVPVYCVSGLIDLIVFNTIEFWSGQNPVMAAEKTFQYVEGDQRFDVKAVKNGAEITYTIDRYSGERYQDTLTIASDVAGTAVEATLRDGSKAVQYASNGAAVRTDGGSAKEASLFMLNR